MNNSVHAETQNETQKKTHFYARLSTLIQGVTSIKRNSRANSVSHLLQQKKTLHIAQAIYICIYIYVCVCVCVCVFERIRTINGGYFSEQRHTVGLYNANRLCSQ
jgi:hypothetical protein